MKSKRFRLLILAIILAAIALRYLVVWCIYGIPRCFATNLFHSMFDPFIYPLFLYSVTTLPLAIVLLFIGKTAFRSWLRLAMWWLPLSVIVIAITPTSSNAWMPLYFVGKDATSLIMAGLFSILSIFLILSKQFNHSKKQGIL